MNTEASEQLTAALTGAINKTVSAVETATEFLNQQSPEVIEQLLRWGFASSFACFALLVGLAAKVLDVTFKYLRSGKSRKTSDYDPGGAQFACFLALSVLLGLAALSLGWIKILIAPKVWLLEYAARVVN